MKTMLNVTQDYLKAQHKTINAKTHRFKKDQHFVASFVSFKDEELDFGSNVLLFWVWPDSVTQLPRRQ